MGTMYISDKNSGPVEEGNVEGTEETDEVLEQIQTLQQTVDSLEVQLNDAVDSTLSREEGLRAAMERLGS